MLPHRYRDLGVRQRRALAVQVPTLELRLVPRCAQRGAASPRQSASSAAPAPADSPRWLPCKPLPPPPSRCSESSMRSPPQPNWGWWTMSLGPTSNQTKERWLPCCPRWLRYTTPASSWRFNSVDVGNLQVGRPRRFFKPWSQSGSQTRPRSCPQALELNHAPCGAVQEEHPALCYWSIDRAGSIGIGRPAATVPVPPPAARRHLQSDLRS